MFSVNLLVMRFSLIHFKCDVIACIKLLLLKPV